MFEGDPDIVTTTTILEGIDYSIRDNYLSPTQPILVLSSSRVLSILLENPSNTTAATTATTAATPLLSRSL